jgi:hypothetical protein
MTSQLSKPEMAPKFLRSFLAPLFERLKANLTDVFFGLSQLGKLTAQFRETE